MALSITFVLLHPSDCFFINCRLIIFYYLDQVTLDVADLGEDKYLSRAVLVTSMGSIQLWKGHQLSWLREESLSDLHAVEIVDLPAKEIAEGTIEIGLETVINGLRGGAQGLAAFGSVSTLIYALHIQHSP